LQLRWRTRLLQRVRQLVREESLPFPCRGRIFTSPKHDIAPDGIRPHPHGARPSCRLGIGVHTYPAEIAPKARLEIGEHLPRPRCAAPLGRAHGRPHIQRCFATRRWRALSLDRFLFLVFTLRAFTLARGGRRTDGRRLGHPHNLIGHIVVKF
jgi:hypothetical protein